LTFSTSSAITTLFNGELSAMSAVDGVYRLATARTDSDWYTAIWAVCRTTRRLQWNITHNMSTCLQRLKWRCCKMSLGHYHHKSTVIDVQKVF